MMGTDLTGKTVSHYRIIEKLGEGGMGVIYKAEDVKLRRTVALKFLPAGLTGDAEARERFMLEAQAASSLNHPNICTIHEIDDTDDGGMFICMACYEGTTLMDRLALGPIDVKETLDIVIQMARGLGKAHDSGIVHRDIKSANIFITEGNNVRILDFGLAKLLGRTDLTIPGVTLGTVSYMSPEQARGEPVDQRTDIWALGIVMYEMVAGRPPFAGDHPQAVIRAILNDTPPPLSESTPTAPAELGRIIGKALTKDPSDRYQSALDLLVDLESLMETVRTGNTMKIPAQGEQKPSIAVLPFTNMSADPEQEYFCDGMAEEIINALVQIEGIRVVARVSAFAFKGRCEDIREIGRKLNVETILEGSVRKAGDQLRITAQLVKVSDGYHLWSERYDRKLEDVFAIQDEIAHNIVDALEIRLSGREERALKVRPTENIDAYQAYLRGLEYAGRPDYSEEDFRLAVQMFERAIQLDRGFALAYAELSKAHSALYFHGHDRTEASPSLARAAVDRALNLQPKLPDAHLALGYYHYWCRQEFGHALAEFAVAERGLHDDARILAVVAAVLKRQGKIDQTVEHYKRAFELSPQDASLPHEIGCALMTMRDYAEAELYYDRSIAIAPDQELAYICKAWNYRLWQGDIEGARRTLEAIPERVTGYAQGPAAAVFEVLQNELSARNYERTLELLSSASAAFDEGQWWFIPKTLVEAHTHRLMGNEQRARTLFESALSLLEDAAEQRPEDDRVRASLGIVYASLGRREDAVREGELAVRLLPVSKNAVVGPFRVEDLAFIHALLGDEDEAVDRLEYLLTIPSWVSEPLLRIDIRWDNLRDYPPFQELLRPKG